MEHVNHFGPDMHVLNGYLNSLLQIILAVLERLKFRGIINPNRTFKSRCGFWNTPSVSGYRGTFGTFTEFKHHMCF